METMTQHLLSTHGNINSRLDKTKTYLNMTSKYAVCGRHRVQGKNFCEAVVQRYFSDNIRLQTSLGHNLFNKCIPITIA